MRQYRLGRTLWHDEASRQFPAKAAQEITNRKWLHNGPVLDQGDLGSCTGNALVQCLNTNPHHVGMLLTEREAVALYAIATTIDPFVGRWPLDDTGSSGLAVAKAARKAGLISAYRHAFGLNQMLGALMYGPVIVGTVWYESMFSPVNGELQAAGEAVGGHEYLIHEVDHDNKRVKMLNSWGDNWGENGTAWISYDTMNRLLKEQGDCTVLVP